MSAQWPLAVVTTSQLYIAVNELQNNLSAGINAAVTTIGLNSVTGFPTVGLVLIDNEIVQYTNVSGNSLTGCTRAFDGTSAAAHSSGATVSFAFCAAHYNNAANEVIAVESYLDTVLGKGTTVTAAEFGRLSGVTSAIQTQLNAKAPLASPTFTGTITTPLTASRVVTSNGSSQLAVSTCTATEIDFVHGVTSAIQTQLNAAITNPMAANLVFSPTTKGVKGTTTNDNTEAGNVGEYVESTSSSFVNAAATGNWDDLVSISLTAGDWDISGIVQFDANSATYTAFEMGISTTSGNSGTGLVRGVSDSSWLLTAGASSPRNVSLTVPCMRVTLSGTTTYYLKRSVTFSAGTPGSAGGRLSARRVR